MTQTTLSAEQIAEIRNKAFEEAAAVARQWRDENRLSAVKARKREGILGSTGMADQLEWAMIECNALMGAILALKEPT